MDWQMQISCKFFYKKKIFFNVIWITFFYDKYREQFLIECDAMDART